MSARERLRELIDQHQERLRATVPADRCSAVVAILRARGQASVDREPDLVAGRRLAGLGGNKALWLCLDPGSDATSAISMSDESLDDWAESFLVECDRLAEAEMVLAHCETGYMQLAEAGECSFAAWVTTRLIPASWRERDDIAWWASWLARHHIPARVAGNRDLAGNMLRAMEHQLGLPPEARIGGCTVATYRDVLRSMIERALSARDGGQQVVVRSGRVLIDEIATELSMDADTVGSVVDALTVDDGNVAWHAAVPAVAAAPLVRIGHDRLVLSVHGLTTEPLFFLARELRRRDSEGYHNVAHLREDVFRDDLHDLFPEKRFVKSAGRIKLQRAEGSIRTDIDAAVFDRKTGTLGLFELKSQEPFARSTDELMRQRDNMLYANRQVSGVLTWLNRHGGDEILNRMDNRVARKFRVHKVYPFVLGRYIAHFGTGPEPDRRAAWGTWPQVLRLLDEQPARASTSNPIASLHAMLTRATPLSREPIDIGWQEIALGKTQVTVFPSHAAYRDRERDLW